VAAELAARSRIRRPVEHGGEKRLGREGRQVDGVGLLHPVIGRNRTIRDEVGTTGLQRVKVTGEGAGPGHDPGDSALMALVGRLSVQSPEFRVWWADHTVRMHNTGVKTINHPVVGEVALEYEVLEVPSAPGIRVTSYLTAPGTPSADALNLLRSWTAEPATTIHVDHLNSSPVDPA
jgi:hypothetical protein